MLTLKTGGSLNKISIVSALFSCPPRKRKKKVVWLHETTHAYVTTIKCNLTFHKAVILLTKFAPQKVLVYKAHDSEKLLHDTKTLVFVCSDCCQSNISKTVKKSVL